MKPALLSLILATAICCGAETTVTQKPLENNWLRTTFTVGGQDYDFITKSYIPKDARVNKLTIGGSEVIRVAFSQDGKSYIFFFPIEYMGMAGRLMARPDGSCVFVSSR